MTDVVSSVAEAQPRGWDNINWWAIVWFFVFLHPLAAVAVKYIDHGAVDLGLFRSEFKWQTAVMGIILFYLGKFAITMLPHRNYAHRSYVASHALQYALLPFFAAVMQGPAKWWSMVHAMHHAYVDTARDRHSPYFGFGKGILAWLYGFWWSHMGWLCTKTGTAPPKDRYVVPMLRHPNVKGPIEWERRHHNKLSIGVGLVLPTLLGVTWGDPIGGFLVGGPLRLVANYHCTWIVNSVNHMIGPTPEEGTARDPWWWLRIPLSIISVGEAAYHGTHHMRPRSWWFGTYDLGGWAIWLCMQVRIGRFRLAWENEGPRSV